MNASGTRDQMKQEDTIEPIASESTSIVSLQSIVTLEPPEAAALAVAPPLAPSSAPVVVATPTTTSSAFYPKPVMIDSVATSNVNVNVNINGNANHKRKRPALSPTASSTSSNHDYSNHHHTVATAASESPSNNGKPHQPPNSVAAATTSAARVGKDGEPLSEKKLRRLEKNRLSARECRRRKREATENMQGQINQLESENLRLRLQLQVGEEAEQTNHQKQIDSTKALDELLKSGKASESEIYAKIEEYKEKFADYGRDRRSAMEFHLRNVERLLMPTQTTSFIMNTLKVSDNSEEVAATETTTTASTACTTTSAAATDIDADASGSSSSSGNLPNTTEHGDTAATTPLEGAASGQATSGAPKTSKELFTLLVKKLQVTPAQSAVLKDSRFVAEEMDQTLKETLNVLKELRLRLAQCGQDLETEFNCIRQILTPSQSAKFLVWVAQNKACMHMLNELWSKNYSTAAASTALVIEEGTTTTATTTNANNHNNSNNDAAAAGASGSLSLSASSEE
mmetsp:Transcript_16888/g.36877  ORF Transcript_16888/g.36877 Transcript_16888/m.36877 type:complete len:514 (-) Transcript_16888:127-1668(-)|eukprot:CAMPEP_0168180900 /NCGR_PEP_ID=MMETSP0139_2-20121125/10847_1 /TAXON_ID=44445 /ORGANISM="Pseudo-nitzschia australis, Strain 10249 10 AB" /LENGTH=513 /DNA_ID=CAMNT_0008101275 /DNA_START=702 /DNA_END=2243 /DNA_ORIENTATION=-